MLAAKRPNAPNVQDGSFAYENDWQTSAANTSNTERVRALIQANYVKLLSNFARYIGSTWILNVNGYALRVVT